MTPGTVPPHQHTIWPRHTAETDVAERFAAALPHGRLVTVPDCGHNVHGQNTTGFIGSLGGFLESLPAVDGQQSTISLTRNAERSSG